MPRTIWNEGRVVGFSAYELYVRNVLADDPDAVPATEKEWLSSVLAMGSSMLLRIGVDVDDTYHYIEIDLPQTSQLVAANNIMASHFLGEGYVSGDSTATGWATKVTDYGPLIRNYSGSHPSADGTTIPPTNANLPALTPTQIAEIQNYMKIIDGIVIQPGTWSVAPTPDPYMDFSPTLTEVPKLRILLNGAVDTPFWVLLTGFIDSGVVAGTTGFTASTHSSNPQNGDFLGPAEFPWSAKIIFSVPSYYVSLMTQNNYFRSLPTGTTAESVDATPIIDMQTSDPSDYYASVYTDASVGMTITDLQVARANAAIFTAYQQDSMLPPALYGSLIPSGTTGASSIYPIDTAAPGTVKLFRSDITNGATMYRNEFAEAAQGIAHNSGWYLTDAFVVFQINTDVAEGTPNRYIPVSDNTTEDLAAMCVYNTKYVWFDCLASGGGNPSQTDLEDVTTMNGVRVLSGYMSDYFLSTFCVDYATAVAACEVGHICDSMQFQKSYIDQLVDTYGQTYVENNYKFFFMDHYEKTSNAGQNGMFYPILLDNNRIITTMEGGGEITVTHGVNFSASSITVDDVVVAPTSTDIMGSYYNLGTANFVSQETDVTGVYVFTDHPIQKLAITDYDTFRQPFAAVPNVPTAQRAKYSIRFTEWLENTPMSSIFSDETLTMMGVDDSYKQLNCQTFMQYLATGRDMSVPVGANMDATTTLWKYHIYSATDITSVADVSWDWSDPIYASLQLRAYMSQSDFFKAADIQLYTVTYDGDIAEPDELITKQCLNPGFHNWASVGQSGIHKTSAISLTDDMGSRLPLTGTSATIPGRIITWEKLIDALSNNKAIDPVGVSIVTCTQQEYADMSSHDPNTLYIITGGST